MIALLDTSKDPKAIAADVAAAWRAPIGAASPLWLMFAGAATAGMAFWWMNRWRVAPTNLEAVLAPELPAPAPVEAAVVEAAAELVEAPVVETVEAVEEVVEAAPEPVVEAEPEPVAEIAPEPVIEAAPEPVVEAAAESAPKPKAAPKAKAKSADA